MRCVALVAITATVLCLFAGVAAQQSPGGAAYTRAARIMSNQWMPMFNMTRMGIPFTETQAMKFLQFQNPLRWVHAAEHSLGPADPFNMIPTLGAPGGDLSTFAAVYSAFSQLRSTPPTIDTPEAIQQALTRHMQFFGSMERELTMYVNQRTMLRWAWNISLIPIPTRFPNSSYEIQRMFREMEQMATMMIQFANSSTQIALLNKLDLYSDLIPCDVLSFLALSEGPMFQMVPGVAKAVTKAFFLYYWNEHVIPPSPTPPPTPAPPRPRPHTVIYPLGSPVRAVRTGGQNPSGGSRRPIFERPTAHAVITVNSAVMPSRSFFDPNATNVYVPLMAGADMFSDFHAVVLHPQAMHHHRLDYVKAMNTMFSPAVPVSIADLDTKSRQTSSALYRDWVDFMAPNATYFNLTFFPIEQPEPVFRECPDVVVRSFPIYPPMAARFGMDMFGVEQFVRRQMPVPFANPFSHHLSCGEPITGPVMYGPSFFDENTGMADEPTMSTPGGDLAPFIRAMHVYNLTTRGPKITGPSDVAMLLMMHLGHVAEDAARAGSDTFGRMRRFYFHTNQRAMRNLTRYMAFVKNCPARLPFNMSAGPYVPYHQAPSAYFYSEDCRKAYMDAVVMPEHVGCHHVRAMLEVPELFRISRQIVATSFQGVLMAMWMLMPRFRPGPNDDYAYDLMSTTINVGYADSNEFPAAALLVYSNVTHAPCQMEMPFRNQYDMGDLRGWGIPLLLPSSYTGESFYIVQPQATLSRALDYDRLLGNDTRALQLLQRQVMDDLNVTVTYLADAFNMTIYMVIFHDFMYSREPTLGEHILSGCSTDLSSFSLSVLPSRPDPFHPPWYVNHSFTQGQANDWVRSQFSGEGGNLVFVEPSAFPLTCQRCVNNSEPVLSSLGGDLAEFAMALHTYILAGGVAALSEEDVYDIFEGYLLPHTWRDTTDEIIDEFEMDLMSPRARRRNPSGNTQALRELMHSRFGDRPMVIYFDAAAVAMVQQDMHCTPGQFPGMTCDIGDPRQWMGRQSELLHLLTNADAYEEAMEPVVGLNLMTRDMMLPPTLVSSVLRAAIRYHWDRFNASLPSERYRVHFRIIESRMDQAMRTHQPVQQWQLTPHAVFMVNNEKQNGACNRRRAAPLFMPRTDPTEVLVIDNTPQTYHWSQMAEFFAELPYVTGGMSARGFYEAIDRQNEMVMQDTLMNMFGEISQFMVTITDAPQPTDNKQKIITGLGVAVGIIGGALVVCLAYLWWLKCKPHPKGTKAPLPLLSTI